MHLLIGVLFQCLSVQRNKVQIPRVIESKLVRIVDVVLITPGIVFVIAITITVNTIFLMMGFMNKSERLGKSRLNVKCNEN